MTPEQAISVSVMTGATDTYAGQAGLVPAPAAGDNKKFLRGDGKWVEVSTDASIKTLETQIESKANQEDLIKINTQITDVAASLNNYVKANVYEAKMTTVDKDISKIKDALMWHPL